MTAKAKPATYFRPPRPGATWSTRGATIHAMIAAITNHELVTSTSLPAMVPTLMVPGGRCGRSGRAGVRDDSERCSDTGRGYPTLRGPTRPRRTVGALA